MFPASERGALEGEETDELSPGGELSKPLLSEENGTVSMGVSMGVGLSEGKFNGRALLSSELSMQLSRGEGLVVLSCSFPIKHFLNQHLYSCCTAAQSAGMPIALSTDMLLSTDPATDMLLLTDMLLASMSAT